MEGEEQVTQDGNKGHTGVSHHLYISDSIKILAFVIRI